MGDLDTEASALRWSITAMSETIERLPRVRAWDRPRAFAVIGEAVWWVTIVDATLVRYHPQAYDGVLACQAPAQRQLTEGTLTGLRFVRNRIGDRADLAEFIEPGEPGPRAGEERITQWAWKAEQAAFGPGRVAHAPMQDHGLRQPPAAWAAAACFAARVLDDQPRAGVLIHCTAGRRRSVMLAHAVLRLRGHDRARAAALVLRCRREAVLVPAYVRSVER